MQKLNTLLWQSNLSLIVVFALILSGLLSGEAASAAPYYQGKIITFVVPSGAGGGTDISARMISKYLSKYIPGNPKIVIRNMPAAGGLVGANYVWHAKPNGLTCLITAGKTVMENILRSKGTEYKLEEMYAIYSSPTGRVYYCKPGLITGPNDIMTAKGLIFGHGAVTSGTTSGFLWAKELVGFEVQKMVFGYEGGGAARLAFLAGEINISGETTLGYYSSIKSHVEKGEVKPVFQGGLLDSKGNLPREKAAPDIPTPAELYQKIHGRSPSGLVWEAYKLVAGTSTYNKTVLLPPNTPKEYINIFRKAAIEMVKDPKFLEESERMNPGSPHIVGEELASGYPKGVSGPPEVIQFMRKVLIQKYGVVFD
ncbi:MAG: tripartite tricarboxylate transporter substrate-binding protein [Thermodesulfobacteriota bacterium]|nr:tripartite tricarboxylate transporter substrate-binding protein [Thermodesulfobacteriota bacterium]